MRAFVFTLDAIFSLVFASIAISALIYVSYSGYIPPSIQSSEVGSIGSVLASAGLRGLGQGSPLYGAGSGGSWPQYGSGAGYSFGAPYGPSGPYLLYSYTASANIIPAAVASGGEIAFAAGNQLYEINATTGLPAYNYPVASATNIISAPAYGRNLLVYANFGGYVTAVSPSNGLMQLWQASLGGTVRVTTPLQIEDGYVVFAASSSTTNQVYFLDPSNGTVVEEDPSSNPGLISWVAHHNGAYYVGAARSFNALFRSEYVNVSVSSNSFASNSFASYGNFSVVDSKGTTAMYANLTAYYSRGAGSANSLLNLTSVPYYAYAHRSSFSLPPALFNTTPSIGGNTTYLLDNGIYFQAFNQRGHLFNVTLPGRSSLAYNYSDIALAYGNAYLAQGNALYAFGAGGFLQQNSSLLDVLGDLYLAGRGGLANYALYSAYGAGNIGIFVNGSYGPSLHVSKFNGINSYIAIPATPKLSPEAGGAGAMSLCGWYKINNLTHYNGLLFQGNQSPSSGNYPEFSIDNGTTRGFKLYSPSGGIVASYNSPPENSNSPIALSANVVGNWYSFCLTYNRTAHSADYYLNGTLSGTSGVGPTVRSGSGAIVIGAGIPSASGTVGYSNVSVADLQLYNLSLTSEAVAGLYNDGMYSEPQNMTGLVGWWPLLGDGNDYSGSGHVGFPSNMTFTSANSIPTSLSRAAQVGRAAVPLQLTDNGVSRIFNVSVVVWTS